MDHFSPHVPTSEHPTIELAHERLRLQYASKIVRHMIDLTVWRAQMGDSMLLYIEKVLNQIWNIYQQGMNMLIASRRDNIEDLQWVLNEEKGVAEDDLYEKCEKMRGLIDQVVQNPSSNKLLKKEVLALLQIMRRPLLPDLTPITTALKKSQPKKHNKMRAMFSFPKKKIKEQ
jgi:hypothetical protein